MGISSHSRWRAHLLAFVACAGIAAAGGAQAEEDSRLSAAVALIHNNPQATPWLENLSGYSYVDAYVLFPAETGQDVIFGIDQEFIDGTTNPAYIKGGDWMGLVGLQRTGAVWVAKGTTDTMSGKPSSDRSWEIIPLNQTLKPATWYHIRTVLDFRTRHYVSFTIEGPGLSRTLDLKAFTVDYPNYMPFDRRMLTDFAFAMRGKGMVKEPQSAARVYFDDMSAGLIAADGKQTQLFHEDFESAEAKLAPLDIPFMTFLGAGLHVDNYKENFWYLEQKNARVRVQDVPWAKSGKKALLCDATLESVDYDDWFAKQ